MSLSDWMFWGGMVGVLALYLGYQEWVLRREEKRFQRRLVLMTQAHDDANDRLLDRLDRIMERYEKARAS